MPKSVKLGNWVDMDNCQATGTNKSYGPGLLTQKRNCIDGTVSKCKSALLIKNVLCTLPNCERVIGNWQTVGNCLAEGSNKSCGPGLSQQKRDCTDGTVDKCTEVELIQNVSCKIARNSLPDCEMMVGDWKNSAMCTANIIDKSCGPGTVLLDRHCADGTNDFCSDIETVRNVSCQDFNIRLPECKGNI